MPLDTANATDTRPRKAYADHETPFVRNAWYVAARSDEIGQDLFPRTLLEQRMVFYRKQDGAVVALHDRCCHRSMPLSQGYIEDDQVVCGYHGLTFDCAGACVKVPSQKEPPANVSVASYPVVERAPFVWVWPGDPEQADETLIPDTHWLSDDGWGHVFNSNYVNCNYLRLHENLMDLTHFTYLHAKTGVGTPAYVSAPFEVTQHGDRIRLLRTLENSDPPDLYAGPMQVEGRKVDRISDSWFDSPAFQIAHATIRLRDAAPAERDTFHVEVLHALTPETATSTHYFWAQARDYRIESAEVDAFTHNALSTAFMEDVVAVEAVEDVYRTDKTENFWEMNVDADEGSLKMRRIIRDLAIREHGYA